MLQCGLNKRYQIIVYKTILSLIICLLFQSVGGQPTNGTTQSTFFNSVFGVATKQFSIGKTKTGITAGFAQEAFGETAPENLNGFFVGVAVSPGFMRALQLIGEYDTNRFNTGFTVLIFRHLFIYGFLHDFSVPVGGLAYFVYL